MKRHYIKIYLSMACVFCRKQRTRKKHQFLWCAKTLDIQMREFGSLYHFALELTLRNFLFICIQKFKGQIHKSILRTQIIYFKKCASTKMRCALWFMFKSLAFELEAHWIQFHYYVVYISSEKLAKNMD